VDEERVKSGHWLLSVLRVSFSAWLGDGRTHKNLDASYPKGSHLEHVEETDGYRLTPVHLANGC